MVVRGPAKAFLIVAVAAVAAAMVAWAAGFFYWEFTISRVMRQLRRDVDALRPPQGDFPHAKIGRLAEVKEARSRLAPFFLKESDRALAEGDQVMACILHNGFVFAIASADEEGDDTLRTPPEFAIVLANESLEDLDLAHRQHRDWWNNNRHKYSPWWMWWSGKRRSP